MKGFTTHPQSSIRSLDERVDALEAGGGGSDPWTYVKLGNDQQVSVTTNTALAFRAQGAKTTQNAASTGLPTTTDSYLALGYAVLVMGASPTGTFGVTLASEVNASAVTIKAGSFIKYRTV